MSTKIPGWIMKAAKEINRDTNPDVLEGHINDDAEIIFRHLTGIKIKHEKPTVKATRGQRYFAIINKEDLKKKLLEVAGVPMIGSNEPELCVVRLKEYLHKDMKVGFSCENTSCDSLDYGPEEIIGYRTLDNGLTFLGCVAGGDWESPVFFIAYWDGKKIRGYIPTEGNTWNTTTKKAYGNDMKADLKDLKKRWPDYYGNMEELEDAADEIDLDPAKIIEDIKARIIKKS